MKTGSNRLIRRDVMAKRAGYFPVQLLPFSMPARPWVQTPIWIYAGRDPEDRAGVDPATGSPRMTRELLLIAVGR